MKRNIFESIKKVITPQKKIEQMQQEISCREAYSYWSILADRYILIDTLNLVKNFSHDIEYVNIIKTHIKLIKAENQQMESLLEKFSITAPPPNTEDMNLTGNTEAMRDRVSSHLLYSFYRAEISVLAQTLKDALLNDDARQFMRNLFEKDLQRLDKYIKYLKIKEWIVFPPHYQYLPNNVNEKVAINEIHYLWDHLVSRHNNIRLTQIAVSYTNDIDFKAIVETGLNILLKQADDLQKKLLNYGVQLPESFTNVTITPQSPEVIEDRFLYTSILEGMKNATSLHALASSEIITNDNLRKFFANLTYSELDYVNNLIRYGKLKGWITIPPKYKMG
ncbi:hypothetical protein GGQ84_002389 [Desulfitispora alkaliphila]|uniref:DUF3231 family protein n=1 Tax=Desulfitispora alkaliphila TaxID=622674 RepID=UPI003D24E381